LTRAAGAEPPACRIVISMPPGAGPAGGPRPDSRAHEHAHLVKPVDSDGLLRVMGAGRGLVFRARPV